MSMHFRETASQIAVDGTISPEEILILRRAGWSDGRIDLDEAEAICAVNRRIGASDPAWSDFFVEALVDYVLNGALPLGEVDEAKADWLLAQIGRDGWTGSPADLALLTKLFERVQAVPERLRTYTIAQIERSVVTDGTIGDAEALALRRLIFAPASYRSIGVDRAEADLLLRLKQATLGATNGAEWTRLFVQGLGNYLMAYTSYAPLPRERTADLDAFIAQPGEGLGRLLAQMAQADLLAGFGAAFRDAPEAPPDAYEQALLDFLERERGG